MKNLWPVFKFEYFGYVVRKSYIGLTLALVLIAAGVISWPMISSAIFGDEDAPDEEMSRVAIYSEAGDSEADAQYLTAFFAGRGYSFEAARDSEAPEKSVTEGDCSDGIIVHSDLSYTRIARNIGMNDYLSAMLDAAMLSRYQHSTLEREGLSEDVRQDVLGAIVSSEVKIVESGKDQLSSFVFTYALIFMLYFAILMYGQFVSTSVATEKSTRTMEILITSTRPESLIFGKVIGTGLAGLTQLVVIITASLAAVRLNARYYEDNFIINAIMGMPPSIFVYTFVFFVLGFFIYAFIFAALASLVSRIEDVGTATMPAMFLFIIVFMIVMFSMGFGEVDSPLMVVASYIPLSSPMAMFARVAMGDVKAIEVIISIVVLAASTIGVGYLATAIYRLGVLLYGVPPKPAEIIRMLKSQK